MSGVPRRLLRSVRGDGVEDIIEVRDPNLAAPKVAASGLL